MITDEFNLIALEYDLGVAFDIQEVCTSQVGVPLRLTPTAEEPGLAGSNVSVPWIFLKWPRT